MLKNYTTKISAPPVAYIKTPVFEVKKIAIRNQKKPWLLRLAPIILVVALIGISGSLYFYNKYKMLSVDPHILAEKETARLVSVLGRLIELPTQETPTVATISDKEKLQDRTFFARAENGDILFAYTTSMKAILYRPSSNKIINVAPISIPQLQHVTGAVKKELTNSVANSH